MSDKNPRTASIDAAVNAARSILLEHVEACVIVVPLRGDADENGDIEHGTGVIFGGHGAFGKGLIDRAWEIVFADDDEEEANA